ncbi:hypothetical protein ACH5RR_002978 [Cinchona calisaya]|uniref:Uncharacterized protein n=1 Tax=Cinchona calisaya TaxID=153742 RepID=A0ABD3ATH5_9GENT
MPPSPLPLLSPLLSPSCATATIVIMFHSPIDDAFFSLFHLNPSLMSLPRSRPKTMISLHFSAICIYIRCIFISIKQNIIQIKKLLDLSNCVNDAKRMMQNAV